MSGQRGRVCGRGDDVQVSDGLAPSPHAARLGDAQGRRMRAELLHRRIDRRKNPPEEGLLLDALRGLAREPSTLSCVFGPSPCTSASRPCSAAARRSASDCTPSSVQSLRAVFGPSPGTCMTSTSPSEVCPGASPAPRDRPSRCTRRSSPRSSSRFPRASSPSCPARAARRARPIRGSASPRAGRRSAGRHRRRRARAGRPGARTARRAGHSKAASAPRGR